MQEHRHDENQSRRPDPTGTRNDRFEERSSRDRGDVERWYGEGGSQSPTAPPAEDQKDQKPVERKVRARRKPIA